MARVVGGDSMGGGVGAAGGRAASRVEGGVDRSPARTTGGIDGKAGANVNPIYKNTPPSMKFQIDSANKGYKPGSNMKVLPAGSKAKGQAENQKYEDMIDRLAKSLPVNRGKGK